MIKRIVETNQDLSSEIHNYYWEIVI